MTAPQFALTCALCGSECENVHLIQFDNGDPSEWIGLCPECGVTVTQPVEAKR